MSDSRKKHEGFVQGTEAYLAAVYYVMKDAQQQYQKDRVRLEKGRLNPWAFLNKIRRALGYETHQVSYVHHASGVARVRRDLRRQRTAPRRTHQHRQPQRDEGVPPVKVNIYETIEVSDEQRVALARRIDGDGAKKRQATRDEIKAFVWEHGSSWADVLEGGSPEPTAAEDEDLLGTDDGDDEDLI